MRFSGFGVVPSDVALGGLWLQTGRFMPSGMLRALKEIVVTKTFIKVSELGVRGVSGGDRVSQLYGYMVENFGWHVYQDCNMPKLYVTTNADALSY